MLNTGFLLASLIWGSIGIGFCVYGKKKGAAVPLIGGLALVVVSYCVGSALLMSLISVSLIAAMGWLMRNGG